jgi:predicted amidohydrolase YtcJ
MKCIPVLFAAMSLGLIVNGGASAAETADLVISGGTIYTGSDDAPFVGDVAVTGDKIVYVGPHAGAPTAKTSIDAKGMIVAPGLIDAHTHRRILSARPMRQNA